MNDDDAVGREVNVHLEAVGARGNPTREGGKGVFRTKRAPAAMGEDERTGVIEEGHSYGAVSGQPAAGSVLLAY